MSMIKATLNGETLFLTPQGRIDSISAPQAEAEITALRGEYPHRATVIDADALEYISSAGLRVILRLRKDEPELKIINVSAEVYEIFEMTGFSEMIPVEKAYRKLSVDGCDVIGRGAKGTVYRWNPDTIVKVYHDPDSLPDIRRERELARKAFVLGVPTAIPYDVVRVGESYGSVFELLNAKSFSQLIAENPDNLDSYVAEYARMLRLIHSTQVKPEDMPDVKALPRKWLRSSAPYLSTATVAKIEALVNAVPDTLNMLHCDYHTNNIMMQNDEALLIDMDTLSHGHPVFELANIYITYVGFAEIDPSNVENFIGFSHTLAASLWEKFLPLYLETEDADRLREVEEKAKLLSYMRLIHHTVRRNITGELADRTFALCTERITALADKLDTLDF